MRYGPMVAVAGSVVVPRLIVIVILLTPLLSLSTHTPPFSYLLPPANSLGDLLIDAVVFYTIKEARKKATPQHPWGTLLLYCGMLMNAIRHCMYDAVYCCVML
jgi:hypothetical protein